MKAVGIRLENCSRQIGIESAPVFCWELEREGEEKEQKAWRVQVFQRDSCCWDSGWQEGFRQNQVKGDFKLKTHTKYQVRVGILSDQGLEQWSESDFVSGICEEWKGRWISADSKAPFLAVKELFLAQKPIEAYVSICGTSQFVACVNQKPISSSVLEGSWTDFNKRIEYTTYDVTDFLQVGNQLFSIETGNGWYLGTTSLDRHFYTMDKGYEPYGQVLSCIAQMTLRYEDGREECFQTNESWQVLPSSTTLTNIYGSEDYDGRIEPDLFSGIPQSALPARLESRAPKGKLVPALHPPVIAKPAVLCSLFKRGDGPLVFDAEKNMSGLFEVCVSGRKGQTLILRTAEKMDSDGNPVYTCNSFCRFTLSGKVQETWRPKFTYQAGRWLVIECSEPMPEIHWVKAYPITSGAEETGEFWCDNEEYQKIYEIILRAIESNLHHIHTDCPTIERLGWQEPNHLMGPALMYLKDMGTLWSKIEQDLLDAQYGPEEYDVDETDSRQRYEPGLIPSIAPRYARFLKAWYGSMWDIIAWGSSVLLIPWQQYVFYGDTSLIQRSYESSLRYVKFLLKKYKSYPERYAQKEKELFVCNGLGDWGSPDGMMCPENIETAYLYHDLVVLSNQAKLLGKEKDYESLSNEAREVYENYNEALLVCGKDGGWYYRPWNQQNTGNEHKVTLANQALPLAFDLVPPEKRESVEASFLREAKKGRLFSGEIGMVYIFRELQRLGQEEIIQQMILQEQHPSYARFVRKGETTLPEFWEDDARSRNHDMLGHIMEWFFAGIGGIRSDDGFHTIHITPVLPSALHHTRCRYRSITGIIETEQKQRGSVYELRVTVPTNASATVFLPRIAAGKQYFCNGSPFVWSPQGHGVTPGTWLFSVEKSC